MQETKCSDCGLIEPLRSFYSLNGKTYCEPCVWKASKEAAARNEPSEYISLGYDTACARCGKDAETGVLSKVGEISLCEECRAFVYSWQYPKWLKLGLAGLLVLLALSLLHGRKYFQAGRSLYRGEQLVDERHYREAIPYLRSTVSIAPGSDKGVLLYAIACLRSGDAVDAWRALKNHRDGRFEDADDPLVKEAQELSERAGQAFDKAQEAYKLAGKPGHAAEAAQKIREAEQTYPENPDFATAVVYYDAGTAFEAKDYDRFVSLSQQIATQNPDSSDALGMLASALACKYAVTGDQSFHVRAMQALAQAEKLAERSADEKKSFQEYSDRIQYRPLHGKSSILRNITAGFGLQRLRSNETRQACSSSQDR